LPNAQSRKSDPRNSAGGRPPITVVRAWWVQMPIFELKQSWRPVSFTTRRVRKLTSNYQDEGETTEGLRAVRIGFSKRALRLVLYDFLASEAMNTSTTGVFLTGCAVALGACHRSARIGTLPSATSSVPGRGICGEVSGPPFDLCFIVWHRTHVPSRSSIRAALRSFDSGTRIDQRLRLEFLDARSNARFGTRSFFRPPHRREHGSCNGTRACWRGSLGSLEEIPARRSDVGLYLPILGQRHHRPCWSLSAQDHSGAANVALDKANSSFRAAIDPIA
jgi:hypothetical protein